LAADWLQESNDSNASHVQNDDDVSANYLRGSRSPPGIATHLLRASAPMSPVKNVCSAKKRWLRQAISEDHTDEQPVNGNASPSDACFGDFVTPLKKRRLASYKDEQVIAFEIIEKYELLIHKISLLKLIWVIPGKHFTCKVECTVTI
jgi:hypothetical protein